METSENQKMNLKSSDLNLHQGEEIHIHCVAHCKKCEVDTLVEQQRVNCQVCLSPLVYYCAMCKKKFVNPATVRSHVIKQLGQASTYIKCSSCYRSDFTTHCSLIKHQSNCNTPYRFNREIVVSLERCNYQSELLKDVKPVVPLLSVLENKSHKNSNSIKTDNNCSYIFDDLEIGEDFKPPLTSVCGIQKQTEVKLLMPQQICIKNENQENFGDAETETPNEVEVQEEFILPIIMETKPAAGHQSKKPDRSTFQHIQVKNLSRDLNASNSCSKCKKSFKSKSYARQHSKTCGRSKELTRSIKFSCDHCNFKTIYKNNLPAHIKVKHLPRDPNANKCNKCKQNFSDQSGLRKHSKICCKTKNEIHSLKRFTCDYCNHKSTLKSSLVRHIQAKHLPRDPNANKCKKCKKTFSVQYYLLKHLKTCGQSKKSVCSLNFYTCDYCNHKTNKKPNLAMHIQAKHLPRDQSANTCIKCKKSYSKGTHFLTHMKFCGQSKDLIRSFMLSCDYCNYKAIQKTSLVRHIQVKHLPRDPNANICSKCNQCFSHWSGLRRHLKICGQSKEFIRSLSRYTCDYCNYKSSNKQHLRIHIQAKHLPRDPNENKCSKCNKCFAYRSSFWKHSQICGRSKNFVRSLMFSCDHCDFKTMYKSHLATHIQTKHLPRDPTANKCKNCKKCFSLRSNLRVHMKICGQSADIIRSLMRSCDHCNYKTYYKCALRVHMQTKHS